MDEFALISRWLEHFEGRGESVIIGPGDDAAAFEPASGRVVVATTDALIDGVHFRCDKWPPRAIGYKALAVNLSDLAAMGARPRYALLALGIPSSTSAGFLMRVARGMAEACRAFEVTLIGGNMSKASELSLTLTVLGEARPANLLRRSGASPGDLIWVSGTVGDSALGLDSLLNRRSVPKRLSVLEARHCMPTPRVDLGTELASGKIASAAIDLSDGLAADLGHILDSSGVGAEIHLLELPLSGMYRRMTRKARDPYGPAIAGGEDYEILFTAPRKHEPLVHEASRLSGVAVARIGRVTSRRGLRLIDPCGHDRNVSAGGWRHF